MFYDQLNVRDAADLYHLTAEQLQALEGFQDKRAQNLMDALEASKHCPLSKFLLAIGIPNIGRRTARDLSAAFGSLENVRAAKSEELTAIDEIGDIEKIRETFETGVREMREFEKEIEVHSRYFDENRTAVAESVRAIVEKILRK